MSVWMCEIDAKNGGWKCTKNEYERVAMKYQYKQIRTEERLESVKWICWPYYNSVMFKLEWREGKNKISTFPINAHPQFQLVPNY